jgi:hypothetical protein
MDKEYLIHMHEEYYSVITKRNPVICSNTELEHITLRKISQTPRISTTLLHSHVESKNCDVTEGESRMVVTRG